MEVISEKQSSMVKTQVGTGVDRVLLYESEEILVEPTERFNESDEVLEETGRAVESTDMFNESVEDLVEGGKAIGSSENNENEGTINLHGNNFEEPELALEQSMEINSEVVPIKEKKQSSLERTQTGTRVDEEVVDESQETVVESADIFNESDEVLVETGSTIESTEMFDESDEVLVEAGSAIDSSENNKNEGTINLHENNYEEPELALEQSMEINSEVVPIKEKKQSSNPYKTDTISKRSSGMGKKRGRPSVNKNKENESSSKKVKTDSLGHVENDEYLVEDIVDKKLDVDGVYKYFIKWIGWPSETNTWEPVEHLNGCEEMLRCFEINWRLKNPDQKDSSDTIVEKVEVKKQPNFIPSQSSNSNTEEDSNYDSEENIEVSKEKTREFLEYDVMEDCPTIKQPEKMLGVVNLGGTLTYLVEWKRDPEKNEPTEDEEPDRCLIKGLPFKMKYPAIVLNFYERHISFTKNPTREQLIAERAANALAASRQRQAEEADEQDNEDIWSEKLRQMNGGDVDNLDSSSDSTASEDAYEVDRDVQV